MGNQDIMLDILKNTRSIAVVGVSEDEKRVSNKIFKYLDSYYEVIPVNPNRESILGKRSYKDIRDIPIDIDLVDIFRPSQKVYDVVVAAIEKGVKAIWMQSGIKDKKAKKLAEKHSIKVIMDRCIMREHKRRFSYSKDHLRKKG